MLIFFEAVVSYDFYISTQKTTQTLIKKNIQTDILNLNHYLNKNFHPDQINTVASHIDNLIVINRTILDIHIYDDNKNLAYHPNIRFDNKHPSDDNCLPVAKIMQSDLLKNQCFTFHLKFYKNLQPIYYTVKIYLDSGYINTILTQEAKRIGLIFVIASLIAASFLMFILKKFIIKPLEQLRRFAYYSQYSPKNFFIKEIESIRYSLEITFERLKREQDNLYRLSTKDPLSGLYNRLSLTEKVEWLITKAQREKRRFALIFLDLDNFKNINDSHGHIFGDKVLLHISKVLLNIVRENDIVSRLGGDEFVIVLSDFEHEEQITEVATRIKKELNKTFTIDDQSEHITASMGITIYPDDANEFTTLLKNADIAMYKSKDLGKNNYYFFTEGLNTIVQEKIAMQKLIEKALSNNQFELFYQPKVDIKSNKIVSCEALIRLIDPINGIIPPDKFIPVAEESDMILKLGDWIIKEACRQLDSWSQTQLKDVKISVNVSSKQLNNDFLKTITTNVSVQNIPKLDMEITESVFLDNFEKKLQIIEQIKDMGITFSLDDFGTGYSSLSYLKNIPFSTLKIDKAFIDDLESKQGKSFVNMIVGIADDLDMNIVAEGVETEEQLEYLKSVNCEMYQGYLCSKPLPAKEFEELFNLNCV
jgi:diguanylate cyclase (GGDEF)-like protein